MKRICLNILLILGIVGGLRGFAQVDQILQPVEIHPPSPGSSPAQQQFSDEQLAAQYFRNREFAKAAVLYEKLFAENSTNVYYTYYLYCLIETGDYESAERIVEKQIKRNPGKLKYQVDLGYIYTLSGAQGKARKTFEAVIRELPANTAQINEVANAFISRGQTEYAVAVYRKGSVIMDYPFQLELGDLYRQTHNFAAMTEAYLDYVDYNPMNLQVVQSRLQGVLQEDSDNTLSLYLRYSLLERVQKDPQKIYFSEMLLWLSVQVKDFKQALIQAKAIDRRLNEEGDRLYDLAGICIANNEFDLAAEAYRAILKKGSNNYLYVDARIGLLYAQYLKITGNSDYKENDLIELEREYLTTLDEYGRNVSTIVIMQYLGHLQAFYLNKTTEAVAILLEAISLSGSNPRDQAACKLELADIYLFTDEIWEAKLLYAQVEKSFKNDPIGYKAKFKNARLSYYIGEYDWARAQLDVLKAATSKLIANDALKLSVLIAENIDMDSSTVALSMYARADLLEFRNHPGEALSILDTVLALPGYHPIRDEVILKKAEILIKQHRYAEAAELLETIVHDFASDITADNALFILAGLYENQFHDPTRAMDLYEQLMKNYPGSLFVVESRKHFRTLRGDFDREIMTDEERFLFDLPPD